MELKAPAKVNLFLKVVGRRSDGYHELYSLMSCVGIYDQIVLTFGAGTTGIECSAGDLPCDRTNIALAAALNFQQALEQSGRGKPESVFIHLNKTIPIGAGMGGGSSNAASVLKGLNTHHGHPFQQHELMALALELGADVPFFIDARPAIAQGIGEKLTPYHGLPATDMVIVYPGVGISTAEVFQNLNLRLTKRQKENRNFPFENGDFNVPEHLSNDLEPVACRFYPIIGDIKSALLNAGAKGAMMTGSGSAVFGLFDSTTIARQAGRILQKNEQFQVFVTRLLGETDCLASG